MSPITGTRCNQVWYMFILLSLKGFSSQDGLLVTAEKVKLTFAHGAQLADRNGLFNAGLGGKKWRAIDLFEGDELDGAAFKELVREAVDYNVGR